jgi:hypothetical protein
MIATGADFAGPGEFGRTRPAGPRSLVGLGKNRRPSARREPEAQRPLRPGGLRPGAGGHNRGGGCPAST